MEVDHHQSKKQRKRKRGTSWLDAKKLEDIPLSCPIPVPFRNTALFLERLEKEIVQNVGFSLRRRREESSSSLIAAKRHIRVGLRPTCKCLEKGEQVDLVVICLDVRPPSMLTYLQSLLATKDSREEVATVLWLSTLDNPTASQQLGRIMGTKRVGALCFVKNGKAQTGDKLVSFVKYWKTKADSEKT